MRHFAEFRCSPRMPRSSITFSEATKLRRSSGAIEWRSVVGIECSGKWTISFNWGSPKKGNEGNNFGKKDLAKSKTSNERLIDLKDFSPTGGKASKVSYSTKHYILYETAEVVVWIIGGISLISFSFAKNIWEDTSENKVSLYLTSQHRIDNPNWTELNISE